jgi:hypothetical protein
MLSMMVVSVVTSFCGLECRGIGCGHELVNTVLAQEREPRGRVRLKAWPAGHSLVCHSSFELLESDCFFGRWQ